MTAKETAAKLDSIIISANNTLGKGIISVQDYLYKGLVSILKDLELDADGDILQTAKNRKVIEAAINEIDQRVNSSQYQNIVEKYLGTFDKIDAVNVTYFEVLFDQFKANRQFLASLQTSTISDIENLLFNSGFESQIKVPLSQILNQNINSGGSFTGLLDQVKTYVRGDSSIDGRMFYYTKQITTDALFNYTRAYQKAVTSDLGLTWFCYSGGLMDKSREFCIERAGHYFKYDEVISWVDLDWQGKRPDTTESSIFIYCAGYFCRHQLIPVMEEVVPAEDIARAKELGYE